MYQRHHTGKIGEAEAEQYLLSHNYLLIDKNFKSKFGEIDIIARDMEKDEIVFFEVKSRTNNVFGTPAEAVNEAKRKHIFKTAEYFLYLYELEKEYVRIDVIEVYLRADKAYKINHIRQAF